MLAKIRTNAYDMFVSYNRNGIVSRYTTAEFVYDIDIRAVEDDSSWCDDCRGMALDDLIAEDDEIADTCEFYVEEIPEEVIIASRMRKADQWNMEDCERLCRLAGMEDEWKAADGETFEGVVLYAAKKLFVEVI